MSTYRIIGLVLLGWCLMGFFHLVPFYLYGIYKEAFSKSFPTPFSQHRHWVFVPTMPVSWLVIIPFCLFCGSFARKAMKKVFGIEHNYFDEDRKAA